MSSKFRDPEAIYFATMVTLGWVGLFIRWVHKHLIIQPLQHCQKKELGYSCMVSNARSPPNDSFNKQRTIAKHHARL
jgi:hypothetical protein